MAKAPGRRGAGASAVFVRVAAAISDDIRRGALRGGDRLPSTRALAEQLSVNRNTIVAAYDELVAQGAAAARGAGGTFVSESLPERAVRRALPAGPRGIPARPGFDIRTVPGIPLAHESGRVRYQLPLGVPDTRLLPKALLSRAF